VQRGAQPCKTDTDGFAHERFSAAREAFEANFAGGEELGASFCARSRAKPWSILGRFRHEARQRRWTRDTIVNVYSITKTMTALTACGLADRGELDFAAPCALLPEFAANGKADITVAQLDEPLGGPVGLASRDQRRGFLRLGQGDVDAGRAGAAVGAGHRVGLSRLHVRFPDRRGGAGGSREDARHVFREQIARP